MGRYNRCYQHRRGQPPGAEVPQGGARPLHQPAQVEPQQPRARPARDGPAAAHGGLHDESHGEQQPPPHRWPKQQHDATRLRQSELVPAMILDTGRHLPEWLIDLVDREQRWGFYNISFRLKYIFIDI